MHDPDHGGPTRPLGATGLHITPLTIGGAPLGSMPGNFGREVTPETGIATALAALQGPVHALDTSAAHSAGESERRIGAAIRRAGGLPDGFVLSTKIARDLASGMFDGAQARRSIAESLQRLGLDEVPLLYLHNPEKNDFDQIMEHGGPIDVLRELRGRGVARSIGVAGGDVVPIERHVRTGYFDVVLTHNRWTLVNRSAQPLIDLAASTGLGSHQRRRVRRRDPRDGRRRHAPLRVPPGAGRAPRGNRRDGRSVPLPRW